MPWSRACLSRIACCTTHCTVVLWDAIPDCMICLPDVQNFSAWASRREQEFAEQILHTVVLTLNGYEGNTHTVWFWATVCKTVRPMLSNRCPVSLSCPVLSMTLVYCCQTVGWIKMKLGMQVGLGSGHIVLDGDPAPLPQKGQSPQFSAHVYCGQMAGWIKMPLGAEPRPRRHCVRWGHSSPSLKWHSPQFSANVRCG